MNSVQLIGRLTATPEIKEYGDNSVASFTLAVERRFDREKADFIRCKAWNKTGQIIAEYHDKGDRIAVSGRIETGKYDGDHGTVFTTDVIVEQFTFVKTSEKQAEQPASKPKAEPVDKKDLPF